MPSNELYHYGVLGMRWGVRRYQNEDGTLTAAGKRRQKYAKVEKAVDTAKRIVRSGESEEQRKQREKREQESNSVGRMHKHKDSWEENGDPFQRKKSLDVSRYTGAVKRKLTTRGEYTKELSKLRTENPDGYNTDNMTRFGLASAGVALGTAAIGSITTHELAKRGKQAAATRVYIHSREVFNVAAVSAAANLGSAWVSASLGGADSAKEYREDKKALRKKYQEAVNDSWAGKTTRHPATKTDGAGTNGSTRDRLNTVGKTDGWGTGTSAAEERLKKYRRY